MPLEVALLTTHTQPLEQDQTEQRTQIQGPSMDILYQVSPARGQLERFKDLYIQTVTGRWQATTEKEFVINQLLYRPQSQTKKNHEKRLYSFRDYDCLGNFNLAGWTFDAIALSVDQYADKS